MSYGKNQQNTFEEGHCKLESSLPSVWVTIIGSQVQPGGFLNPTLHPSHGRVPLPVCVVPTLSDPQRSRAQLRWCFLTPFSHAQA